MMTKKLDDLPLLERLRHFASQGDYYSDWVDEAVVEIERLKTANAQMLEHGREMWADVERLRAVISRVCDFCAVHSDHSTHWTGCEAQHPLCHIGSICEDSLGERAPVEPTGLQPQFTVCGTCQRKATVTSQAEVKLLGIICERQDCPGRPVVRTTA